MDALATLCLYENERKPVIKLLRDKSAGPEGFSHASLLATDRGRWSDEAGEPLTGAPAATAELESGFGDALLRPGMVWAEDEWAAQAWFYAWDFSHFEKGTASPEPLSRFGDSSWVRRRRWVRRARQPHASAALAVLDGAAPSGGTPSAAGGAGDGPGPHRAAAEPAPEPEGPPPLPESGHPYMSFVSEAKKIGDNPLGYGVGLIASTRRPQNAISGVHSGAKTFLKCAGLSVASAFSTPFLAAYTGAKEGASTGFGVLAAGTATAAALAASAVAVPSVQIARGLCNTPDAIAARMDGKVWDSEQRVWGEEVPVLKLESLAALEQLLAEPETRAARKRPVKETALYDLLGVEPDATAVQIKKAYRRQALVSHPDKNSDDPHATEKFQEVGKAYQILSDERMRAAYDAGGAAATDEKNLIDSTQLYEVFFGSEKLEPAVGELLLLKCAGTVMEMQQSGSMDSIKEQLAGESLDAFFGDLDEWQLKRQAAVAMNLARRLDAMSEGVAVASGSTQGGSDDAVDDAGGAAAVAAMRAFEEDAQQEADELATTPFGATLLHTIGYAYSTKAEEWAAKQRGLLGSLSTSFAGIEQSYHSWEMYWHTLSSAGRAAGAMQEGAPGVGVQTSEGMVHAAEALVKLVEIDVEHTLHAAADWVLGDTGASAACLGARTTALAKLGRIFVRAADSVGGEQARRKWRADMLRGAADATMLQGLVQGLELQQVVCVDIQCTMNFRRQHKEWTEYYLGCYSADQEWCIRKRFSAFEGLREFLIDQNISVSVSFPGKALLSHFTLSRSTVLERKQQLQAWLYALLEEHGTNKAVKMFLRDDGSGRAVQLRSLSEDFLPPSTLVEIQRLGKAAHHNGSRGRVIRYDQAKGRYVVRLSATSDDAPAEQRGGLLALKFENLHPVIDDVGPMISNAGKGLADPTIVWRLGGLRRLLGEIHAGGVGAAIGSDAFELDGLQWLLRLAIVPVVVTAAAVVQEQDQSTSRADPEPNPWGTEATKPDTATSKEAGTAGAQKTSDEGEGAEEPDAEDGTNGSDGAPRTQLWLAASLKNISEKSDVSGSYAISLEGSDGSIVLEGCSGTMALPKSGLATFSISDKMAHGPPESVLLGTLASAAAGLCRLIESDDVLRVTARFEWLSTREGAHSATPTGQPRTTQGQPSEPSPQDTRALAKLYEMLGIMDVSELEAAMGDLEAAAEQASGQDANAKQPTVEASL